MTVVESSLRLRLRSIPRAAWILFAGSFINKFGSFVVPFLVLYLRREGYTMAQAGWAVSAYGVGTLCSALAGGALADRIGRRNTIVISMFSGAATLLVLSQARTLEGIILLSGLAGLTAELYRPASAALITDLVPPEARVTAFSLYRLAINAGFALGPAAAGFLAERTFFWLFVGDALTALTFGIVAWAALPHGLRHSAAESGWRVGLAAARRDVWMLQMLAATLCVSFVFFQMTSSLALQVKALGFSSATFGLLLSLNGLIIVPFELPLSAVTQRHPPRLIMAIGYALIGVGFALTAFAGSVPALAFTVVIWTIGEMCSFPMNAAYVSSLAPEKLRGNYLGLSGLTWSLGMVLGPPIGTALFAVNPTVLWFVCGALGMLAAVIILPDPRGRRGFGRDNSVQPRTHTNRHE